jgi:hypothetical protein
MRELAIYNCFKSRTIGPGKKRLIGVEEAKKLKRSAVLAGFTTKKGVLRKNLSSLERIVILMREAISGEEFDHEWWAAEISKPKWVKRLDGLFSRSWLSFPEKAADLESYKIGDRIGYELGLGERHIQRYLADRNYSERVDGAELEKATRGLEPEDAAKVRLVTPGFKNQREVAKTVYQNAAVFRAAVMALAGAQSIVEFTKFIRGLANGASRAAAVDLENELSEFNEREEILNILTNEWPAIDRLKTRKQVTEYIVSRLPEKRRAFLQHKNKDGELANYVRFEERLRQTFYEQIGLRPRGRGRPKIREKDS